LKKEIDFNDKILKEQIITYLGNKRKLINFIDESVSNILLKDKELSKKNIKDVTFFDIFAGSGIVSRYSKLKGMKTYSNDLELYSYIIQKVIIGNNLSEIENIFKEVYTKLLNEKVVSKKVNKNYYKEVLIYLNSLKEPKLKENYYFSKHYAPKDTNNPDFDNERLFYTQENGRKIDAIQELIQNKEIFDERAKNIILTSLMYNMTWHINTSGTMKGFHNGWGGKGGNAKERILGDIILNELPFIDGVKGNSFNDYAEKVFKNNDLGEMDIIYADPPYNQHQYSANYNHLTTLAKNDKYEPGEVVLGSRAGIRVDHTRSDFCKSSKTNEDKTLKLAEVAFMDFIKNVKAKYIIMSYSNEGVVSIDRLMDLMSEDLKNTITIEYQIHDKFKGGKGTQTSNKVMEYLIIIQQNKKQNKEDYEMIKKDLLHSTQKTLFLDKYINYNEIEKKEDLFTTNIKDNIIEILFDTELVLNIDKKTCKIIEENISILKKKEIDILIKYEMNNLELMNFYLESGDKELSTKLLNIFKIKKYEKEFKDFKEKIELL